jgi:hypothetical protein
LLRWTSTLSCWPVFSSRGLSAYIATLGALFRGKVKPGESYHH